MEGGQRSQEKERQRLQGRRGTGRGVRDRDSLRMIFFRCFIFYILAIEAISFLFIFLLVCELFFFCCLVTVNF